MTRPSWTDPIYPLALGRYSDGAPTVLADDMSPVQVLERYGTSAITEIVFVWRSEEAFWTERYVRRQPAEPDPVWKRYWQKA